MAKTIFTNAIICDDFRREENGKGIAIGIYRNTLTIAEFPREFDFRILLIGRTTETCRAQVKVKFEPFDGSKKAELTFEAGIDIKKTEDDSEPLDILLPAERPIINFPSEGKLSVLTRNEGARKWIEICRLEVIKQ